MKVAKQIVVLGALVITVALLVSCPPNGLLIDLQQKVQQAQAGSVQTVSTPTFSPTTGTYSSDQSVTITDVTAGATIHYTVATGGSTPPDPTSSSPSFNSPISVSGNGATMTIKAIATKQGMNDSTVATAVITINYTQVSTPQFTPSTGSYDTLQTVTVSTGTPGASIRYTTDGSTPTDTTGNSYSGAPISVSATEKITAIAYKSGLTDSTIATAMYTFPDSAPTFSPAAGTYISPQTVTISTTIPGASIRYTTDGSMPTDTTGTVCTGPVSVVVSQTLKAIAYESGWADSPVATAAFTITGTVAAPTFSPPAGSYTSVESVTISTTTTGASIRYTTDGSTPSSTVGTVYTTPVPVTATETIKAIGYESGWADSQVAVAAYTISVTTRYFAYVVNDHDNTVSAYQINAITGALNPVSGSPFATGSSPFQVATDPAGKFVYVTSGGGTVSAYTINSTTGALTAVSGSPFPAGSGCMGVAVDPTANFVYTANDIITNGTVSAFAFSSTTGALTAVTGSPFSAGSRPQNLTVDPTGKFLYVSNWASNSVSAYSINSTTGALTVVSGSPYVTTGMGPQGIAVEPMGKFVYVVDNNSNHVYAYAINSSTGSLSATSGSPFNTGSQPRGIAIDPTGKFAYVTNYSDSTVSAYALNSTTGVLNAVSGSPFAAAQYNAGVAVDPTARFLYTGVWGSSGVVALAIDPSTGALSAVSGSPFASGNGPWAVATVAVTGPP